MFYLRVQTNIAFFIRTTKTTVCLLLYSQLHLYKGIGRIYYVFLSFLSVLGFLNKYHFRFSCQLFTLSRLFAYLLNKPNSVLKRSFSLRKLNNIGKQTMFSMLCCFSRTGGKRSRIDRETEIIKTKYLFGLMF